MKRLTRATEQDNSNGKKSRNENTSVEEIFDADEVEGAVQQGTPPSSSQGPSQQVTPQSIEKSKDHSSVMNTKFCENMDELIVKAKDIGNESEYSLSKFTSWNHYAKLEKRLKTSVTLCGVVENNSSLKAKPNAERYDVKLRLFNNEQDILLALCKDASNHTGEIMTNRFSNEGSMIHFTPKVFNKVEKKKFVMESYALNHLTHKYEKTNDVEPGMCK